VNPPTLQPLGPVLDFMRLLWAIDHQLSSVSKRMTKKLGITGPQRLCIRLIGRFPGIAAGELADALHVHPSTLTGVLKRLETRGLVVRKPDPADKRRALLELTAKGRSFDQQRAGTVESAVRHALARMPEWQVTAARDALSTLASELSAAPGGD
jgi:MarR family transcriptional regulator, organic hydroperoxide resistance regulator